MARAFFVVGLGFTAVSLQACAPSDDAIQDDIDESGYCAAASECVPVGPECPFGCDILVNVAEADRIRQLLADHEDSCYYDCQGPGTIACTDGRCEMRRP
jgi:hypothetical protein